MLLAVIFCVELTDWISVKESNGRPHHDRQQFRMEESAGANGYCTEDNCSGKTQQNKCETHRKVDIHVFVWHERRVIQ